MDIVVVGLNHKTASVEIRERLSFSRGRLKECLEELSRYSDEIKERIVISTCNRVEVYARAAENGKGIQKIKEFLSEYHHIPLNEIEDYLYCYSIPDSVRHVFRVSAGVDSMIVGEPQILGQIKDSYFLAKTSNYSGLILNQLFERAFKVAKRVRTETRIAEAAVSISFAAVELAKKIFAKLQDKCVMLIGVGEMAELAMRYLAQNGVKTFLVTNRTYERACKLAEALNGKALRFEHLKTALLEADIVISSTSSPHFVIKKEGVQEILKARRQRPIFFIDIAVPRDIDPEVNELDNVYLFDIDDLERVVTSNRKEREREAKRAEKIIEAETLKFTKWLGIHKVTPIIVSLREKAEQIRHQELKKALAKWGDLPNEKREILEGLTSSIVNKILHEPTINIKKEAEKKESLQIIRRLFNL